MTDLATMGSMKQGTRNGLGPLKVPDVRDWRYEEGDAFLMRAFGTGAIVLGVIIGYWTVTVLVQSSGWERVGDLLFLAAMWVLVGIMALTALDGRAFHLRRKDSYVKLTEEPLDELEADMLKAIAFQGIRWSKARTKTLLGSAGLGGDEEVYEYQLEGEGFRVLVEHWGPTKQEPERDHSLLIVGPVSDGVQGRILSLIREYETQRGREPPSLHVYGKARGEETIDGVSTDDEDQGVTGRTGSSG